MDRHYGLRHMPELFGLLADLMQGRFVRGSPARVRRGPVRPAQPFDGLAHQFAGHFTGWSIGLRPYRRLVPEAFQVVQEPVVALRNQRAQDLPVGRVEPFAKFVLQPVLHRRGSLLLRGQFSDVDTEPVQHDFGVARFPQDPAKPREFIPQAPDRHGTVETAVGPEHRTGPARGRAHVVHRLGLLQPDAGIVRQDLLDLRGKVCRDDGGGGRLLARYVRGGGGFFDA
jgi:hypothetical protein